MSRQVNLRICNLRSSLINLPPILASQLAAQAILPQSLGIELRPAGRKGLNHLNSPRLYVGWSGLTASITGGRLINTRPSAGKNAAGPWTSRTNAADKNGLDFIEHIELEEALAAEMGWKENDRLLIKFHHHNLGHATTVNVEPVTVDDWEILEANPQYLEDNLLKQIRVLTQSQTLLVWVYDKTLIKVKVISILPSHTIGEDVDAGALYLITNDTEIIVSPKIRADPSINDSKEQNQILGGAKGTSGGPQEKASSTENSRIDLKLLPEAFSLNFSSDEIPKQAIKDKAKIGLQRAEEDEGLIAALNPEQFLLFERTFPTTLCSLTLIMRPNQETTSRSSRNLPNSIDPELPPRNYSNKSSRATKISSLLNTQAPLSSVADRVRVVSNSAIPSGFIFLPFNFKRKWFSSLSLALDQGSSIQLGSPGDYEYVRIGLAKEAFSEPSASLPREPQSSLKQEPDEKKSDNIIVAGFQTNLDFCQQYLHGSLITGNLFTLGGRRTGNQKLAGLLICGSSGAGKTSLVKKLIERVYVDQSMMLYSRYIDCGKHIDDRLSVFKSNVSEWFDDAIWHSPSLLVFDDMDKLLPAEAEHIDSFRYRHLTEEFLSIASAATKDKLVFLIGTCSSSASIHNLLSSGTHFFGETLQLKGLSRGSRKEILTELINSKALKSDLDISRMDPSVISSERTEGYLPSDLKDLVDRAVHQAVIRSLSTNSNDASAPVSLELIDFDCAQTDFTPISLRDVKLQKSSVNWADIGGLAETRRILRETLEWPTKYPSIFANCPLKLRSGLLLYGYPGCGKTLLASAIAKECGLNFISIKGPELLNKYIGASEKSVRDLFDRAQVAKPCVLFFDEFESIAPKRGHDSTGVTDRVVNQLLTQMDGAEGLEGVYVLAATSRPDLIDPALLRPGRLDKSLLCSMPTEEERCEILQAVSRKLPLSADLEFNEVAMMTEGFTGADLQALIYSAHLEVVQESIETNSKHVEPSHHTGSHMGEMSEELNWLEIEPFQPGSQNAAESTVKSRAEREAITKRIQRILENTNLEHKPLRNSSENPTNSAPPNMIEMRHLRGALQNARPSVPQEELYRLSRIYRNFVSTRSDGGLPGGEASGEIGGRASLM